MVGLSLPLRSFAHFNRSSCVNRNDFSVGLFEADVWYNTRMKLQDDPNAYAIMGCAMRVHKTLGPGYLESAYGDALEIEFDKAGIPFVREDEIRIFYDGKPLRTRHRADFTCFDQEYLVKIKALFANVIDNLSTATKSQPETPFSNRETRMNDAKH